MASSSSFSDINSFVNFCKLRTNLISFVNFCRLRTNLTVGNKTKMIDYLKLNALKYKLSLIRKLFHHFYEGMERNCKEKKLEEEKIYCD